MKTVIVLLSQMLFLRMLFYESLQSTEKWVSLKSATSMIAESIEKHCMNQKRKLTIGAIMTQHNRSRGERLHVYVWIPDAKQSIELGRRGKEAKLDFACHVCGSFKTSTDI